MLSFITVFLVGLSFTPGNFPEAYHTDMVMDIIHNFHSNWIIIQAGTKTDQSIINLSKEITDSMNVYTSVLECKDFRFGAGGFDSFRPLVLLTEWSSQDCLKRINLISKNKAMERLVWAALTLEGQSNTSMLDIPINSLFLLIEETIPGLHTLTEVYRVSSLTGEIYNKVGSWSSETGLTYTEVSFEERRSNFQDRSIPTLIEPENSTNRLYRMFLVFYPTYLDLAKRLNFKVDNVTNPGEEFEVSITLHWMDVHPEPGKCHLPPLSSSWNSIFFHDVGIKMKLDSYVKPLNQSVWLAMGLIMVLAGLCSYRISYALNRLKKTNMFPLRIDIYIYRSLYIFLQKSECSDLFAAHRIVTISQWMISICLMTYYSATFTSFVSVIIPKSPFSSLDDILEQRTHNIVSPKHISAGHLEHIRTNGDVRLRKLYKNHFDPKKNLLEDPIRYFCVQENYIIITSEMYIEKVKTDPSYGNCKISNTHIRLAKRHFTWTIDKLSHYDRFLRFYLNRLHMAGALDNYARKHNVLKKDPEPIAFRGMTFEDTLILFIAFIVGSILSVILLFLEMIYKYLRMIKTRRFQLLNRF